MGNVLFLCGFGFNGSGKISHVESRSEFDTTFLVKAVGQPMPEIAKIG